MKSTTKKLAKKGPSVTMSRGDRIKPGVLRTLPSKGSRRVSPRAVGPPACDRTVSVVRSAQSARTGARRAWAGKVSGDSIRPTEQRTQV